MNNRQLEVVRWAAEVLVMLLVSLMIPLAAGSVARAERLVRQEERIRALEDSLSRLQADLTEVRADVKELLKRSAPNGRP